MDIQGFFQRWGTFLLLGAAAFLGAYFLFGRKNKPVAAQTSTLPGVASQPGANGQPVVEYVPTTGDSYTNVNYQTDSGNVSNVSNTTTNTGLPVPPVLPPVHLPPPHPVPPPVSGPPGVLPPPVHLPPPPVVRPPQPPITPHPPPPFHPPSTYTVKSGDNLSAIAARHHTTWQILYNMNKSTIDSWSAKYHHPIPGGPWNNIFPNEPLLVPA